MGSVRSLKPLDIVSSLWNANARRNRVLSGIVVDGKGKVVLALLPGMGSSNTVYTRSSWGPHLERTCLRIKSG